MNTASAVVGYAALAAGAKILFDHFRAYGESRWLFFAAVCALVAAVTFETSESGCNPSACSVAQQRKAQGPIGATAAGALCNESKRVTWRMAYVLAFAVFTVLNINRIAPRENLMMLLVMWAFSQATFGYIAFHRFGIWCPKPTDPR